MTDLVPLSKRPREFLIIEERGFGANVPAGPANTYNVRDLNTTVRNEIVGASLAAAANQFTLPIGKYKITGWSGMMGCSVGEARLFNTTAGTEDLLSGATFSSESTSTTRQELAPMNLFGVIDVTALSVYQLETIHVANNGAVSLYGVNNPFGVTNVYSSLVIEKIG